MSTPDVKSTTSAPGAAAPRGAGDSASSANALAQPRSADGGWVGDGSTGGTASSPAVAPTKGQVRLLGAYYIMTALVLLYMLFKTWPPQPWPMDSTGKVPLKIQISFLKWWWDGAFHPNIWVSPEHCYLFMVVVGGALGSYIHATTSFTDYVGNRKLVSSWNWWYVLRPFIGVVLALIFWFVVRAGFLTGGGDINPYGVIALGALAGMFSKQATDKLEEVFTTIFRPAPGKGDAKRGDKLGAPTVSNMTPREGPTSGATEVIITGTDFVDKATVTFDGQPAASVSFVNATTMKATTPPHAAGTVEVVVTNPDGQEGSPTEQFTYLDATEPDPNADPNVDVIDGCDVDIEGATADEDLPATEGGVAS